jgi:hypothetical protein
MASRLAPLAALLAIGAASPVPAQPPTRPARAPEAVWIVLWDASEPRHGALAAAVPRSPELPLRVVSAPEDLDRLLAEGETRPAGLLALGAAAAWPGFREAGLMRIAFGPVPAQVPGVRVLEALDPLAEVGEVLGILVPEAATCAVVTGSGRMSTGLGSIPRALFLRPDEAVQPGSLLALQPRGAIFVPDEPGVAGWISALLHTAQAAGLPVITTSPVAWERGATAAVLPDLQIVGQGLAHAIAGRDASAASVGPLRVLRAGGRTLADLGPRRLARFDDLVPAPPPGALP